MTRRHFAISRAATPMPCLTNFLQKRSVRRWIAIAVLAGVPACASTDMIDQQPMPYTASPAASAKQVSLSPAIDQGLSCIKSTGVLRRVVFGVGPWVDSTGKINAVAQGATGAFLPQAGTASFVTHAIKKAGGQVLVQYFGPAEVKRRARYAVNGIFNSLDFGTHLDADVRVAGVGPTALTGWAQLTLTVQLDSASTRMNRQTAVLTRAVRYTKMGVTAGKIWGDVLVTGGVKFHDQQRLQFESINGPIAMGVIEVIAREFPSVRHCRNGLVTKYKNQRRKRRVARSRPFADKILNPE